MYANKVYYVRLYEVVKVLYIDNLIILSQNTQQN